MAPFVATGAAIVIASMLNATSTNGRPPSHTQGGRSDDAGSAALSTAPSIQVGASVCVIVEESGRIRIGERVVTLHELRRSLCDRVGRDAATCVRIIAEPEAPQDRVDAVAQRVAEAGVKADRIAVRRGTAPKPRPHDPKAIGLVLRRLLPAARGTAGIIAADETRIAREVESRGNSLRRQIEIIEKLVADWFETGSLASRATMPARADR